MLHEIRRLRLAGRGVDGQRDRPQTSVDEIRKEVPAAIRRRQRAAAVDIAAGDRVADRVVVFVDRLDEGTECGGGRPNVILRAPPPAPTGVPATPAPPA